MIIYLEDKRREAAQWAPKLQHLLAGIPLFLSGFANFQHDEAERPLAILEMSVAAIVVLAFIKELRAARRHAVTGHREHSAVGWFDLAAGGLLIFEAFHGAHGKPGYLRPQFLAGIATLGVGLFHTRLHQRKMRRRYLKLDDNGMEFRPSIFSRLSVSWEELISVGLTEKQAVLQLKDGRQHKIGLTRYHNRKALHQGLAEHVPSGLLLE